jgi:CO/xanthine dehydrogenase Mo-binding subunit
MQTPIALGFWRSVGHSYTAFMVESFIDELAEAAQTDPLAFRMRHMAKGTPVLQSLERLQEFSQWQGRGGEGLFRGVAVHESFSSACAQVVDLRVNGKSFWVETVHAVISCGLAVNPDIVKAQIESAIIFGLSAALFGEINVVGGVVQQRSFSDYPLVRHRVAPKIRVDILPSSAPPTGVGEPGVPPLAPALANALFAATNSRFRQLPLLKALKSRGWTLMHES